MLTLNKCDVQSNSGLVVMVLGFVFLGFENFVNNFTLGFCFSSVIMLEF